MFRASRSTETLPADRFGGERITALACALSAAFGTALLAIQPPIERVGAAGWALAAVPIAAWAAGALRLRAGRRRGRGELYAIAWVGLIMAAVLTAAGGAVDSSPFRLIDLLWVLTVAAVQPLARVVPFVAAVAALYLAPTLAGSGGAQQLAENATLLALAGAVSVVTAILLRHTRAGRRLESQLALLVRSSDDAIIGLSATGTIESWNAGAERIFGHRPDEAIGRQNTLLVPPARLDESRALGRRTLAGERIIGFETQRCCRDGRVIDVSLTISPVLGEKGRVVGVSLIARDVTERRRAAQQLAAGRERLRRIIETSHDAFISLDADGVVTEWNPSAAATFGWTREDAVGRPLAELIIPPSMRAAHREGLERARRGGPARMTGRLLEMHALRRDGTQVPVELTITMLEGPDGPVFNSFLRDVTERRRAEKDLKEATERFRGAFDVAPIGMALVGRDGRWLRVNRALREITGYSEQELLATDFQSITHPDDLIADLRDFRRVLRGELDGYEMEKRYRRPDGTCVWVVLAVSVVREDGDPLYVVAQVQEITERKRAEEELRRYAADLEVLSIQDPLTGLLNRREFDAALERAIAKAERFTVTLFDVDHLKAVNDAGGHAAGDRLLRAVATALDEAAEPGRDAYRLGGDEFAILLAGATREQAMELGEHLRGRISALTNGRTVSFGVGEWPLDGPGSEALLLAADLGLYASKPGRDAAERRAPSALAALGASVADRARDRVEHILAAARTHLGMDVAYFSEFVGDRQVFRAHGGDAASFGIDVGGGVALDDSYCARVVDGELDELIRDTAADPRVADLPVTSEIALGAYVGVPVRYSDGRLYGTLCCASHEPQPTLRDRDVAFMRVLAQLLADILERQETEAANMRLRVEGTGLRALLSALEARDHYTGKHSETVVELVRHTAAAMVLAPEEAVLAEQVALLHDVGKVGIPDAVLQKEGPLTEQEWVLMRRHPEIGERIVAAIDDLGHLAPAVRAEHERWDGGGYPDGLKGEEIPLASRLVLACDAYHAMTSDRPYRPALARETAMAELSANAGSQFDPRVVDALLDVVGSAVSPEPPTETGARFLSSLRPR